MTPILRKRLVLYGALIATAALSAATAKVGSGTDAGSPSAAVGAPPPTAAPESAKPGLRVELERLRAAAPEPRIEGEAIFAATSWYVPPPPPRPQPRPVVVPPPPSAPPMPFSFFGRYEEDGVVTILLVRGDRIYTVSEGEVIDNTYRVDKVTARQLELTYLPLNIRQAINAGGS